MEPSSQSGVGRCTWKSMARTGTCYDAGMAAAEEAIATPKPHPRRGQQECGVITARSAERQDGSAERRPGRAVRWLRQAKIPPPFGMKTVNIPNGSGLRVKA